MSKTIAIAGMGWLGQPLASHLSVLGFQVRGSVTNLKKAITFKKQGLDVHQIVISEGGVQGGISKFLDDVDCLVVMIPPGLRRNTGSDFVLKMTHLLREIVAAGVKKVVLVSSISVYGNLQGTVNEKDIPKPEGESGRQLYQVEQLFFNTEELQTTIVRFGGLFGGSRQPVRYLSGRTGLRGGNAPVNLIHRNDCIGILSEIIKQDAFGHIFNAVVPHHPTKSIYYQQRAKTLNLEPPQFLSEAEDVFKTVNSTQLDAILNYAFKVDTLY